MSDSKGKICLRFPKVEEKSGGSKYGNVVCQR
jgi:hypothetical protein